MLDSVQLRLFIGPIIPLTPPREVMDALLGAGVAISPVYSAKDIAEDPHYAAREAIVTVDDPLIGPVKQPAPVFLTTPRRAPP